MLGLMGYAVCAGLLLWVYGFFAWSWWSGRKGPSPWEVARLAEWEATHTPEEKIRADIAKLAKDVKSLDTGLWIIFVMVQIALVLLAVVVWRR